MTAFKRCLECLYDGDLPDLAKIGDTLTVVSIEECLSQTDHNQPGWMHHA